MLPDPAAGALNDEVVDGSKAKEPLLLLPGTSKNEVEDDPLLWWCAREGEMPLLCDERIDGDEKGAAAMPDDDDDVVVGG